MELFPSHENSSKVLIFSYVEKCDRISHSIIFVPEISLVTIPKARAQPNQCCVSSAADFWETREHAD